MPKTSFATWTTVAIFAVADAITLWAAYTTIRALLTAGSSVWVIIPLVVFGACLVLICSVVFARWIVQTWWSEHRGIGKNQRVIYAEAIGDPRDPSNGISAWDLAK
ncbi:hypothetical protein [Kocuria sp. HSID16901]|uniref:hypothetical protein n=1 Tax=Kocuria sp. HSID16901 TaxID=2419505 RepID=UPI000F89861A|nr:hypothetical protein [Kocuria sp. HSID16901]RUQ19840.1 hypothetical protein D8M21_10995 [Kocuria sp. HSID16901]